MKIVRLQAYRQNLLSVVKRIVQDLEDSHTCQGKLSITRVFPSAGLKAGDPAGDPYLVIEEEKCDKLLGLIPYSRRKVVLVVREGFYDIVDRQSRDLFVVLRCSNCEAVARKHLEDYGRRNFATHVVYWGRSRLRPKCTVSLQSVTLSRPVAIGREATMSRGLVRWRPECRGRD